MHNFGSFKHANDLYAKIAKDLKEHGQMVGPRGLQTLELLDTHFTLENPLNSYVTLKARNLSNAYVIGELLWYFSGRNDLKFISKYSKFWNKISDDGVTSNSAYGYILMHKHNFNQIDFVVEALKKDIETRRAVVTFNTPYPEQKDTKDMVCTLNAQFLIRDNKLNMYVNMRSNDFNFGLPYDLIFFTTLQAYVHMQLLDTYEDLEIGTYNHHVGSTHVYEKDFAMMDDIINEDADTTNDTISDTTRGE